MASFSGDLSTLTAPPFILSSTSLTEYSSYWISEPSIFTTLAKESDPERRAVLVLKWFISTLKQQYSSRNEKLGSEKKPLNPFLGEIFLAEWKGDGKEGDIKLVSEQVSHHPPVTAYCISNTDNTVQLIGYNGQKASITRSLAITVKQVGHATLRLPAYDESYTITLPALHIEGLMSGAPYVELEKSSYIVSTSGYVSRIDYSGRGWLSGKKNTFSATLFKKDAPKDVLYTADGQWTEGFCIKDKNKKEVESWKAETKNLPVPIVKDISEQDPLESRRAWSKVAEAIKRGDMEATQREKSIIENQQREMRKKEKEDGKDWERRYFQRIESDPVFDELAHIIGETAESEKTGGVWIWKGQ